MVNPRSLIREIHRRSLWQVLGIYLVASWVGFQVIGELTDRLGLPDWVPGFAIVLFITGLPVVLATAFVQEGIPTSAPSPPAPTESAASSAAQTVSARRLLTWRNAILGGVGAFALLGVSVAAYFVMRTAGIGPPASLLAQGVIEERDPVVLADFGNTSVDSTAGQVVTEALRVDLLDSRVLALVPPARVREVLVRMSRDPDTLFTGQLAHEVARRDGYKAYIEGDVASAGSGYVITASIVAAESGDIVAGFRETARNADGLVDAIDRLSGRIRERAGEGLRSIRAGEPLSTVTTASLDALRKYSEAVKLSEAGRYAQAIALLEEAVRLDTAFAMAYRKLSVLHFNSADVASGASACVATMAHLDRLGEKEEYLAVGQCGAAAGRTLEDNIQAYQNVLRLDPHESVALNNLGDIFQRLDRFEEAEELLERGVSRLGGSVAQNLNLVQNHLFLADISEARSALESMRQRYPSHWFTMVNELLVDLHDGDSAAVHAAAARLAASTAAPMNGRAAGVASGAFVDASLGHVREANAHYRQATQFYRAQNAHPAAFNSETNHAALLVVVGDTAAARTILRGVLANPAFEALPPTTRPYFNVARVMALAGMVREARQLFGRWEAEVTAANRMIPQFALEAQRAEVQAAIHAAEGDLEAALTGYQTVQTRRGCLRCYRSQMASIHASLGHTAEAIALLEQVVAEPDATAGLYLFPTIRVGALERLGALYEQAGEKQKAAAAYVRFGDLWEHADPELQPRVRLARERAQRLLAESGD